MKEKIKKYWWIIIILLLVGGAFYWYEWRPTKIKEKCSAEAHFSFGAITEPDFEKSHKIINTVYNDCLMRFGLK